MRIGILGASSEIARDFSMNFIEKEKDTLLLYTRNRQSMQGWLMARSTSIAAEFYSFDEFPPVKPLDALINFVGVGNPERARALGPAILDITYNFDTLALNYIREHPDCRYIFLSSGAIYGSDFTQPVNAKSLARIKVNSLQAEDYYAIAKLYAESRHRSMTNAAIVDLRIFNYFSCTQNMNASYLICEVIRAIKDNSTLRTSSVNLMRDYLHPTDFFQIVKCVLGAIPVNKAIDCYSLAPIDKLSLLGEMKNNFGLKYEIVDLPESSSDGIKLNYYSLDRGAQQFGYQPYLRSLDGILQESEKLFLYKTSK